MNLAQVTSVKIRADQVIIGTNPECADMVNPRGHIFGFRAYLVAEAPDGSRWVHAHGEVSVIESYAVADLQPFAQRVCARIEAGGRLNADHWTEIQPGYGSDAYVKGGWEHEAIELEKREAEEESWR